MAALNKLPTIIAIALNLLEKVFRLIEKKKEKKRLGKEEGND
jgi:hypothetical protein